MNDVQRQNLIAGLLHDWGLIEPIGSIDREWHDGLTRIKVIRHSEKENWNLVPKYNLGKIKAREAA